MIMKYINYVNWIDKWKINNYFIYIDFKLFYCRWWISYFYIVVRYIRLFNW